MKKWWLTGVVLSLCLLVLVGTSIAIGERNRLRMVSTVQDLKDIGIAHIRFRQTNKRLPNSLEELDLEPSSLFDPATQQPYVWVSPEQSFEVNGATLVAKQPANVCVLFWPFGERRHYGAFADGSVQDIYRQ